MRYFALATDFDGTLAHDGVVSDEAIEALKALRKSGRYVIMVTGRLLKDFESAFSQLDLFDLIVAENGAVLYEPATKQERTIAQRPPDAFAALLRSRRVTPLEEGNAIVSTWEPYQQTVLDAIQTLGLELQVIFNKGAVMVLPSGVNKASGLNAALNLLKLSPHNVVGVGDAENDHAFMRLCECSAAVANALDSVKATADLVLRGDHGAGVCELAQMLLDNDLSDVDLCSRFEQKGSERCVPLGMADNEPLFLEAYLPGTTLLAGPSGEGKSTIALGVLERIIERGYQTCIFDPEGDYAPFAGAVVLGDAKTVPTTDEVTELLSKPDQNVIVNLLGVPVDSRAQYIAHLLPSIHELRSSYGRPHWIAFDEAHHVFPEYENASALLTRDTFNVLAVTVRPGLLAKDFIDTVERAVVIGGDPREALRDVASMPLQQNDGDAGNGPLLWRRDMPSVLRTFTAIDAKATKQRHRRKYATGDLAPEKSFYFTGPKKKLNLRVNNLTMFSQISEGLDDESWLFHLRSGDYAKWFCEMLGDEQLASIAEEVKKANAKESRERILKAIADRYTSPA